MSKPYVFINDRIQTCFTIKTRVGGNSKFDVLNAHIRNAVVMPGQLVIVSDGSTGSLTAEETELMNLARNVHRQVKGSGSELIKNYDLMQNMLSYGSLGIGAATGSWSKHLNGVQKTLEEIERLYKLSLARGTPIARQEFINQRRVLFARLDVQLEGIARWGTGLTKKGPLKKMLGLSTKSYLRTGEIQGYAARIAKVAKVAKLLKHGTPVGIGLNAISAGLEVKEACSVGRTETCTRAKYTESGKFIYGVAGGIVGGSLGASTLTPICIVVMGASTGGVGALGCGIATSALGGYAGGLIGESIGKYQGELIYEWIP
ncbi:hypothetical protein EC919_115140 [Pseudomonas graminis]|uniref:hypothetical protein n=1 Tax=Pseudomonas graminis TaxID=158627 RepID=UPI0010604CAF|nr:hypothetical protein [Pseudomonas graminis]TDV43887.1 hypothetical protein EC919_115140 [Pseudomonas graminis]